jgi:hypothetical protein
MPGTLRVESGCSDLAVHVHGAELPETIILLVTPAPIPPPPHTHMHAHVQLLCRPKPLDITTGKACKEGHVTAEWIGQHWVDP